MLRISKIVFCKFIETLQELLYTPLAIYFSNSVLAYAPLPKVTARGKSVAKRLRSDKKTTYGVVHFVLPKEIGEVEIVADVPDRAVVQAVEELRYLSRE